jgi:hypothetical protein
MPKKWATEINDTTHAIHFPEEQEILPLELQGVISTLTIWKPIHTCKWLMLTNAKEWDPQDSTFAKMDSSAENFMVPKAEHYIIELESSNMYTVNVSYISLF